MKRMVSVFLPHWPIERLMRERRRAIKPESEEAQADRLSERPLALVGSGAHGLTLIAVNAAARAMSLAPGLSLVDARTIHPALLTLPAAPGKDATALLALARWAERFSPSRALDGEDGLLLDVTGLVHLFGGEHALLERLANDLARLGFSVCLALAGSIGAAWAFARFGATPRTIIPEGGIKSALAPLPVEALRIETETVRLLKRLGLKRIGQLYDLPRASLKRRFASKEIAEAVLSRLDQALGLREENLVPLRHEPPQAAVLSFAEPLISHEGVVAALRHLSETLCASLERAERGARRAQLVLFRSDGASSCLVIGFSRPCSDPAHLCRLLAERLDGLDLGFGVDQMRLRASALEPLRAAQTTLRTERCTAGTGPLIDRLANRLGHHAVCRLDPQQSHLPERAQTVRSAFAASKPWPREVLTSLRAKPPRPALLLHRPERLAVIAELPEGAPAQFTWRRVSRRVVKAEGPERIAPEWWRLPRHAKGTIASPFAEEADLRDREGDEQQTPDPLLTPLPTLPRKGGGEEAVPSSLFGRHPGESRDPVAPGHHEDREPRLLDCPVEPGKDKNMEPRARDYYRIEDEAGRRYWVFREGLYQEMVDGGAEPGWFLQGLF